MCHSAFSILIVVDILSDCRTVSCIKKKRGSRCLCACTLFPQINFRATADSALTQMLINQFLCSMSFIEDIEDFHYIYSE